MSEKMSEGRRRTDDIVCRIRRFLIRADDLVHVLVAAALLLSAFFMLFLTAENFREVSIDSTLMVINDVLFVLIIMELLWTVIRYLKRQEFSLKPFIAIGIISSLRRILMLEAQMSMEKHADTLPLVELGVSTGIALALVLAYYLVNKVDSETAKSKEG